MDLEARIFQLEELIKDARSMPLSSSVLVNREEALELVNGLREALPEEIKQARWVTKDREELLAKARRDAEALLERAQAEQLRLTSREGLVLRAQEEAERILSEAREQARQIRLEAEDYVDARLARFEVALGRTKEQVAEAQEALDRTLDQVARGRERLRGPSRQQREADQDEAEKGEGA